MTADNTRCSHCGFHLSDAHTGPCPNCGLTGKTIKAFASDGIKISDSLSWKKTREFYEKNKFFWIIIIILTIISPFIGLIFAGPLGILVGIIIGGLCYFLGPLALTKVREIERGS